MLTPELQQKIQKYYRETVESRSLALRQGQKVMIAEVAKCFAGSVSLALDSEKPKRSICVIEAGTGTGKTLAYAVGALPVAMEYGKPLVISTATVALQEQLFYKDLPDLKAHSSLDFQFALVKGRARYVCLSKLLLWEQSGPEQTLFFDDYDPGTPSTTREDLKIYRSMIEAINDGSWDGERDHWKDEIGQRSWSAIMANRQDCTAKKCPYYSECHFFEARKQISEADCIVTNHDLVMADLFQNESGILPAMQDAFYIFDEGHHLPAKALEHFASSFRVKAGQIWLAKAQNLLDQFQEDEALEFLPSRDLLGSQELITALQTKMDDLYRMVEMCFENSAIQTDQKTATLFPKKAQKFPPKEGEPQYCRFENANVPAALVSLSLELRDLFQKLSRSLLDLLESIKAHAEQGNDENIMLHLSSVSSLQERVENSAALFTSFSNQKSNQPFAKWLSQHSFSDHRDFQLASSPINASTLLDELIWSRCQAVLITSATLTALGDFSYFIERSGLPSESQYFRIASPFNYAEAATLVLPEMQAQPHESVNFAREVAAYIEKWQSLSMGTLVLFSSWAQLNDVCAQLPVKVSEKILIQGNLSKDEILTQHKTRVDQHQQSTIFGLASFAEGIDLPGDYLTHVIICKIPFSVPTDPMAEALAEWVEQQGRNAFRDISIPEASLKLIQACGRLLRSETDTGRISILDRRLRDKYYGKQLLAALPPYRVQYSD